MTTKASAIAPGWSAARPPAWLIVATGVLAAGCLAMAVAETTLWMHYLIDAGESISLAGLGFIMAAGVFLYTRGRLLVSLPLALPWLLFPVITQGDQIIDNLSINWMRFVCHVLLGLLFAAPVAIVVLGAGYALGPRADGKDRQRNAVIATLLFVAEMWIAVRFLGLLMVATLAILIAGVVIYGFVAPPRPDAGSENRRSEHFALIVLLVGGLTSLALFVGFKNRPGAYQGSPSYFMDPAQKDAGFKLDAVPVPNAPPKRPDAPELVTRALTAYALAFEHLLEAYYVLDRNYNYDFHNRLFLRHTPLLPNYRAVGLTKIAEAAGMRAAADREVLAAREQLSPDDPLAALLADVTAYAAYTFDRAPVLERMSAQFEQTEAGLQHATHLFEGEGKVLGVRLADVLTKHERVLRAAETADVTREFAVISRRVHDAYANRIVGF